MNTTTQVFVTRRFDGSHVEENGPIEALYHGLTLLAVWNNQMRIFATLPVCSFWSESAAETVAAWYEELQANGRPHNEEPLAYWEVDSWQLREWAA